MVRVGYFLSSEEHDPRALVDQARMAEDAGFAALWISDRYHPWTSAQGQSPFVWGVIGALSEAVDLPITTAVTCPVGRLHPAVLAQAAATAAVQTEGRFTLGIGTGAALDEHITGAPWPPAGRRRAMLEEAVEVIRALWTGRTVDHHGPHYTVENARLYTRPETAPKLLVAGAGRSAARLAARIGDGFITTVPDRALVEEYRRAGGGPGTVQGGVHVCWSRDRDRAVRHAHTLWANALLPGDLDQVLPGPAHVADACRMITEADAAGYFVVGDDPHLHAVQLDEYARAGCDEVYVNQIGPEQRGFFAFYADQVLPRLTEAERSGEAVNLSETEYSGYPEPKMAAEPEPPSAPHRTRPLPEHATRRRRVKEIGVS